ncbi:MAG TPA: hypothetical protein VLA88_05170, partial [Candidatus Saccharimonadales bacterium]|nr:hypothetical protein [Candidatus Saccharimonadales bacterium]
CPGASWTEYAAVAKDDQCWSDELGIVDRLIFVRGIAASEVRLVNQHSITSRDFEAVRKHLNALAALYPDMRSIDEVRRILAVSLFEHGHASRGHTLFRTIENSAVAGEAANGLLGRGATNEAVRVLVEIQDTDVVMMVLEQGVWQDPAAAAKLRHEIMELNKYEPEWRSRCMESLATMREGEGQTEEARQLRSRADLLRRQVASGYLRYKPRKK